jgi:uncharacterized protein (TIGR02246 family)
MKLLSLTALVLTALIIPSAVYGQTKDEAAVKELHASFVAAWNAHDAKKIAANFAADADLINPFGRVAKGRDGIEELFADEHGGPMAKSSYAGTIESIRFVGTDVAIIDVNGEVTGIVGADGSTAPPFKHHVTWVAAKKDGKWQAICARAFVAAPRPQAPN